MFRRASTGGVRIGNGFPAQVCRNRPPPHAPGKNNKTRRMTESSEQKVPSKCRCLVA